MTTISLPQVQVEQTSIPVHDPTLKVDPKDAWDIVGGLSKPGKMPCFGISLDARRCTVGSALRQVKGSTCSKCYAMKGNYVWPGVRAAMERRYKALYDPRWVAAMASAIRATGNMWFRWHDSGDLQDINHLTNIVQVAMLTPKVQHWLPTREVGIVRRWVAKYGQFPPNLTVRVSAALMDTAAPAEFDCSSEVAMTDEYGDARRAAGANMCPAYTQGGKCLECRTCWDSSAKVVVYPKH